MFANTSERFDPSSGSTCPRRDSVEPVNGLDITGIALLTVVGVGFIWLGTKAIERTLDLNLGEHDADNTPKDAWDDMNRHVGRDLKRCGTLMAATALALAALTFLIPAGIAGITALAAAVASPTATIWVAARHIKPPDPNWHP